MTTIEEYGIRREAWFLGLLSGDYPQGQGVLKGSSGFCCLGVAADVWGRGKWVPIGPGADGFVLRVGAVEHVGSPPAKLVEWLGLSTAFSEGTTKRGVSLLIRNNDSDRMTFDEIVADVRAHPELYFVEGTFRPREESN